jgi:YHS domain-containing protein
MRNINLKKGWIQMKRLTVILSLAFIAAAISILPLTQAQTKDNSSTSSASTANQTLCPVTGKEIDARIYTDIQGQRVYHCCSECSETFKANPDKYFKAAAENGIRFENIQKVCPMSGQPIDKSAWIDYNGRRIYFCCDDCNCLEDFKKSPEAALSNMDKPEGSRQYEPCRGEKTR